MIATVSAPQATTDFSGTFALASQQGKHAAKTLPKILLRVVQRGASLEIVDSLNDGKPRTRNYFLDGRKSSHTTSGGIPTVDKVEAKGRSFVIRTSYRLPSGSLVRETERWELSSDSKTLTIRSQIQFKGSSWLDDAVDETYQRL
jgi:hypothetical protein